MCGTYTPAVAAGVDLVVELHGVPVRVGGVEHSHDVVHIAHRHGERAGREVADALRVQDVEESAEFALRWNPASFATQCTIQYLSTRTRLGLSHSRLPVRVIVWRGHILVGASTL